MVKKRPSNKFSLLIPVVLLVLAGLLFRAYQEYKSSKLINLTRYTFINQNSLVSLDIKNKNKITINFPDDLYVDAAYGYGKLRFKNVYQVGELDKRGEKVLAATISDLLGVPVSSSPFSYLDQLLIRFYEFNLRSDKIINLPLPTEELVLADGTKVLTLDRNKWDFTYTDNFTEPDIVAEDLKVEVLNAGEVLGLGNQAARLLSHIGIDVVNVANLDIPIKDCEVKMVKPSKTALRIADIFGCKILNKDPGRADISLILRVLHPGE
ncbi:MAG: LytR C-terminal domain-containing protein [bacterium]|nr:LytR C-terminal domain-containing protein [bacterium]